MLNLLIKARCLIFQAMLIGALKESQYYCNWMTSKAWELDWFHQELACALPEDLDLSDKITLTVDLSTTENNIVEVLEELKSDLNKEAREAFKTDLVAFSKLLACLQRLSDFTTQFATKLKVRDFVPTCEDTNHAY